MLAGTNTCWPCSIRLAVAGEACEKGPAALGLCNPGCTLKLEVERELTGRETEPWEIGYFKLDRSQLPVVDRAIETAAHILGSDKSRGYWLEMICAFSR